MKKVRVCPVCGKKYDGYPALSRKDNRTEICPDCGVVEALSAYFKFVEMAKKEGKKNG